jgi:DNA-binding CsgD family transcriptional regulator
MANIRGSERNDNKQLTEKLQQYIHYFAQGLGEKEIAKRLNISQSAVYNRLMRVMDITGCLTRDEVIQYAKEHSIEQRFNR